MSVEAKQLDSGVAVVTITGLLAMGGETERLDAAVKSLLQKDQKKFVLDLTALDYPETGGPRSFGPWPTTGRKGRGELGRAGANPALKPPPGKARRDTI